MAGAMPGVTTWNVPMTPNALNSDQSWFSVAGLPDGKVYIGAVDGKLYAFLAKTGTPVPGFPKTLGAQVIHSSPAVGFGNVYVATAGSDHKLYAFNASGCRETSCLPLWTASTGGIIRSSPTVANGVVYVGSEDHNLYAFHLANTTP